MGQNDREIFAMLDLLSEQLGGEMVLELVTVYTQNSADQVTKMQSALAAGDFKTVSAIAHSLKSSSANMGAELLREVCLKVEKSAGPGAETPELVTRLSALRIDAVATMAEWKQKK